jgi:excisionase family DNA binding protein
MGEVGQPLLLTIAEAAELLRCSERQIYYLIARADLPVMKLGARTRIPRVALERWVEERTRLAS